MSTAGKVLTVVVMLSILGWIFLFALVGELNRNWGEKIDGLDQRITTLEQQTETTEAEVQKLIHDTSMAQRRRDQELTVLRSALSDVQKRSTHAEESHIRLELQVASAIQAAETAAASRDVRIQEKEKTTKDLTDLRARVDELQGDVAQRTEELTSLQGRFLSTMEENRRLLERLQGRPGVGQQPRRRILPASFRP